MDIKDMRKQTNMTQKQFAEHFDISIRTLQSWEAQYRQPPDYVPGMMYTILEYEGFRLKPKDQKDQK